MHFPFPSLAVPRISTEQMIEVDRSMIEAYGIDLTRMMENAGRGLALVARDHFFDGSLHGKKIAVLAGTGGNGGGALVAARRLANWGAEVWVGATHLNRMTSVPAQQAAILRNMGIPVQEGIEFPENLSFDLILDGVIGYSINGDPRGAAADMIHWANHQTAPILSLDTPSGLNLSSGFIYEPTIKAEATLTLALPKHGLFAETALPYRGKLFLADISVPPSLYAQPSLNLEVGPIFAAGDVLRLA